MNEIDLSKLYDAYASGIFRYLVCLTKSESDARDLLQEFFVKLGSMDKIAAQNEKAFLYRMAHNLAVNFIRHRSVRQGAAGQLVREIRDGISAAENPDAALLARAFSQALESLPGEQSTVVRLRLLEGLSFEEIAEAQDIRLNTAASRYRYGLEKMRLMLRKIYDEIL